jgi:signal transduction histidine kinase/DNA-binding response OmpR family regulator
MATYTNIPAGTYTFEVMGSNNSGMWNPEPAGVAIVIAPFFYETKWFAFILLISVSLIIYGGIRLRVRRLKQAEKQLKQLVKDKTTQLRREKEKTEMQAEGLKELDRAKTRFFTNISHELRTPLTLIIGPLQHTLSSSPQKYIPPDREELHRMLRNGKRLLRLIDQTLELTKIEQGKLRLHVQQVNVRNFLEDLIELFKPLCRDNEISLSYSTPNLDKTVFADPYKLDNIVGNLLSNAIKFTPAGGEISVEAYEDEKHVFISVTDTGTGIAAEHQEKIFDRFFQVSSSETRDHEGSGIGLSIAHDFATLHQGSLRVDSEPGKGSVFTLSLKKGSAHFSEEELQRFEEPYFYDQITDEISSGGLVANSNSQSGDDQTTVLVVEDNGDLRSFIREVLEDAYRVLEAENGSEALNIVEAQLPDLIVTDIMMPEMDGITFNRTLKENPGTASVPLIFLTAKTARHDQLEGLDDGADDYITKPFDPLLLKARVNNLIESRMRLRHLLQSNGQESNPSDASFISTLNGDPFLKEVNSILEKEFSNPEFQVANLASGLNLSRSYMARKLKKKTGLTPGELIKTYRMEKASLLLKEKSGNISEVAYAVGYKSLSYFSHTFKEHFEQSPSEFLKTKMEA